MYLPEHFAESRREVLAGFIAEQPFGLLITTDGDGTVDANGIPFLLDDDPAGGPGILRAHVARANPVWRDGSDKHDALVVFQGPHAYVSPAWYPSKAEHGKVVPTWNYAIVSARGRLKAIEDGEWLHRLVTRLTMRHEHERPAPWAVSDAPAAYIDALLRAIVGIEIELTSLSGKWKVSQNRPVADRQGVVRGLRAERGDDAAASIAAMVDRP